jgi:hypothetical protein
MQADLMHDVIREWPRYVKVPFPIAKVNMWACCMLVVIFTPKKKVLLLLLWTTHKALGHLKLSIWFTCTEEMILLEFELFDLKLTCTEDTKMLVLEQTDF